MSDEAEKFFKRSKYGEAAKLFEELAENTGDTAKKKEFLKKASEAYHQLGSFTDEAECVLKLAYLSTGEEKINYLISVWRIYIMAIAVYQYDRSFEWKGEDDNLDGSYQETINGYYNKAVDAIILALRENIVDKDNLLETLGNECAKRQNDGGWGAEYCWRSIHSAWSTIK